MKELKPLVRQNFPRVYSKSFKTSGPVSALQPSFGDTRPVSILPTTEANGSVRMYAKEFSRGNPPSS